jgi:phytoene dehydrogenase-like protein
MNLMDTRFDTAIVGAGFTGLTAGLTLARAGLKVVLLESDSTPGGLRNLPVPRRRHHRKFYHHWFNNDSEVPRLVAELGVQDRL